MLIIYQIPCQKTKCQYTNSIASAPDIFNNKIRFQSCKNTHNVKGSEELNCQTKADNPYVWNNIRVAGFVRQ